MHAAAQGVPSRGVILARTTGLGDTVEDTMALHLKLTCPFHEMGQILPVHFGHMGHIVDRHVSQLVHDVADIDFTQKIKTPNVFFRQMRWRFDLNTRDTCFGIFDLDDLKKLM
jgi:hypothetical protein